LTAMTAAWHPPDTAGGDYVVTPDGMAPLAGLPRADRGAALDALIAQEIGGGRLERVPRRVAHLLRGFGFGWEPLSEPGHMRALGHAAFLLDRAKEYAASAASAAFRAMDIPCIPLDGVSVTAASDPVVADYLTLTSAVPGLYGDTPYAVTGGEGGCMLRQTACFQKYSVCRERRLAAGALPVALFEISDSFRREPEQTLQLSYRLRRFHLPEAHVHAANLAAAVETSLELHQRMLDVLADLDVDLVLLVSATHEFVTEHPDHVTRLVEAAKSPALLRVGAMHQRCQDGVEVDVEYKVVDSAGGCRELCTFQIDQETTRRFGVRCDDGSHPVTIHSVLTGSVERYLYTVVDRIARSEADGIPRCLPAWLAPVHARVVPADLTAVPGAVALAGTLVDAGVRAEVDDRGRGMEHAVTDADACLVPVLVLVTADSKEMQVRDYRSAAFRPCDLAGLIGNLRNAMARTAPGVPPPGGPLPGGPSPAPSGSRSAPGWAPRLSRGAFCDDPRGRW
jgi:threonyl-tRNA synthetase